VAIHVQDCRSVVGVTADEAESMKRMTKQLMMDYL
jgi:hypothetical protein